MSEAIESCTHDDKDSCDRPPVTIDIPPVLAYHTATLRASATSVEADFTHWQNRGQSSIARSFRHPSGKLITISIPYDSLPSSEDSQADYWEERTLETMLNQWYEQGIALCYAHQAYPQLIRSASPNQTTHTLSADSGRVLERPANHPPCPQGQPLRRPARPKR